MTIQLTDPAGTPRWFVIVEEIAMNGMEVNFSVDSFATIEEEAQTRANKLDEDYITSLGHVADPDDVEKERNTWFRVVEAKFSGPI